MVAPSNSLELDELVQKGNVGVLNVLKPWKLLLKVLSKVEELLGALNELLLLCCRVVNDVLKD